MEQSTVPGGRRRRGARLPGAGRPGQPRPAARLPLRHGAAHRAGLRRRPPSAGLGRAASGPRASEADGPVVGVLYYRAQHSRATPPSSRPVPTRSRTPGGRGRCRSTAPRCAAPSPSCCDALAAADALVVTVLAAGGTKPADASARRRRRGLGRRRARRAGRADPAGPVPDQQPRAPGPSSDEGLSPLDAATQVAVPEFDGRLITVPFSFKEIDADGLPRYVADPERAARVAGIAVRHARLRHIPTAERADRADAVGVPDQARPHRQRRRPGHPGQRGARCCARWREAGLRRRSSCPAWPRRDGDALIHALIAAGGQDPEWLTEEQLAGNPVRIAADRYRRLVRRPARGPARRASSEHWGPAPGELYVDDRGDIVLAALRRRQRAC